MKELQVQWVYTALASLPPVEASSSHIDCDEDRPNSISGIEVGAWLISSPLSSS